MEKYNCQTLFLFRLSVPMINNLRESRSGSKMFLFQNEEAISFGAF